LPSFGLDGRGVLGGLLSFAVAVQVIQGVAGRRLLTPYDRSYWLINYQAGFTRRGLAGAVIHGITGGLATVPEIEGLQWLVTLTLLVAICLLTVAALRHNSAALDIAAIALCCSPFVIDFVVKQRRPDEAGFAIVIFYGLALYKYPARAFVATLVAGIALAVAVLVEDAVFLECVAWAAAIALLSQSGPVFSLKAVRRVALLCVPATIAVGVSVAYGRLDAKHVNELVSAASRKYSWVNHSTPSVYDYLADGLKASYQHVADLPLSGRLVSVGVPAALLALQFLVMLGVPRARVIRHALVSMWPVALAVAGSVAALGVLILVGVDWTRWMGAFGLMATVTATFALLMRDAGGARERLPLAVVFSVAAYLLWLAPLPDQFVSVSGGFTYLIMVPRGVGGF
jgi:hypothetical protein